MKKILSSMLVVSVTAALISLGTSAYFSDVETSRPYTAKSGSIDIKVAWPNGSDTVDISDLKPSMVRYLSETVTNVGRNPVVLYKSTLVNRTTDGKVTEPERKEGTTSANKYEPKFDIDKVILYDLTVKRQNAAETTAQEVIIPDPPDGETGPTLAQISSKWIRLGVLKPGETVKVIQSYHMKKSTTNWAQEDTVNFTMDFRAQQLNDDTTFRKLTNDERGKITPPANWSPPSGDWSVDSFFDIFYEVK